MLGQQQEEEGGKASLGHQGLQTAEEGKKVSMGETGSQRKPCACKRGQAAKSPKFDQLTMGAKQQL